MLQYIPPHVPAFDGMTLKGTTAKVAAIMFAPLLPAPFPPPLKKGGTVGLIAPGRWPDPAVVDGTVALLEERGYTVVTHPQVYLRDGQLAGSDAARAEALMDMFADPTIDAVMCARGGTGALPLLKRLKYDFIAASPKPFVGFSDATVLVQAIRRLSGFVTYHGPMGVTLVEAEADPRLLDDLLTLIGPPRRKGAGLKMGYDGLRDTREGRAEGILVGGNITLLQTLIGTPYDWSGEQAILFLEDTDEPLYKIDRALQHFALAGKFEGVRAVLVGEATGLLDGETGRALPDEQPYGRDLRTIVEAYVPKTLPLAFGFPCGHSVRLTTLPVGAWVHVDVHDTAATLTFAHL